ncbi:MAG: FAD-binding oxidoreductase [Nocardioides sp.]
MSNDSTRLITGWGRTAPTAATVVRADPEQVASVVAAAGPRGLIARGLGRSYGDPAQNAGGTVLDPLPGAIWVDAERGLARTSAGTSLHGLICAAIPQGYFVPVTPGTRFVTVGGAIAADVHGKNHHHVGSVGSHVVELDLVTADGATRTLGPNRDPELTTGHRQSIGLTGVITSDAAAAPRGDGGTSPSTPSGSPTSTR